MQMDQLIAQLEQRAGLSNEQARKAAEIAVGFLKSHLPGPIASQLDHFLGGSGAAGSAEGLGGVAKEIGGFLGERRNPE